MPMIVVVALALLGVGASTAYAQAQYRSAFADYKAYREPQLADWRVVNDEVKAVGGHAGHTKPAAARENPPKAKPATGGHEGHHR